MTYNFGKYDMFISPEDRGAITDVAFGTTAGYAYEMYLDKKRQIAALEYECELLVDKYHSEMRRSEIPCQFREHWVDDMFGKSKKEQEFARGFFMEKCFSKGFLKKHKVEFVSYRKAGYSRTSVGVVLGIGEYEYTVEIPLPQNIFKDEDKKRLMGEVKFRVDRLHKSKKDDYVKTMESVQMPTYDWKACFDAIERDVDHASKKGAKE